MDMRRTDFLKKELYSSRMLKKSARLSCSFGLFGLSGLSRLVWFVWFVLFIWLNQTNQMDQIDRVCSRRAGLGLGRSAQPTWAGTAVSSSDSSRAPTSSGAVSFSNRSLRISFPVLPR